MKRFTRLQRLLLILIALLSLFSCIMMGLRQNALTNIGYSAWTYIKYGLIDYPVKSLVNMTNDVANLWHVYSDNVYLNEQLAAQRSYQTLYQDEKNKNTELESLLKMQNGLKDAPSISASVISRSPDTWNEEITISAGSAQKVEKGMLIVTSQGVAGIVKDVQVSTSTVSLLTSDDKINDIAIKIPFEDGTSVDGILQSYDAEKKAYRVSLFDNEVHVNNGTQVATSGKGGNYPSGLFVGTVIDTNINDDAISSTIYVKPISNISSFDYVLCLGQGVVE